VDFPAEYHLGESAAKVEIDKETLDVINAVFDTSATSYLSIPLSAS